MFWNDPLSNATAAQKQMRDVLSLAEHALSSLQEVNLFWQRMWRNPWAMMAPPSSMNWMSAFGVVPLQEHLSLIQRYEEVKERVSAHEETIRHLRLLLKADCEKEEPQASTLQSLTKTQVDAFFTLMKGGLRLLP